MTDRHRTSRSPPFERADISYTNQSRLANGIFAACNCGGFGYRCHAFADIDLAGVAGLQRSFVKSEAQQIALEYQLVMNVVESNEGGSLFHAGHRKFGRIYQCFWLVRGRRWRHLQSE